MSRIQTVARRVAAAAVVSIALVALSATTVSAEVIDRVVAQVNEEIITEYELEQAAVPFLAQQGQDPAVLDQPGQREQILEEVLDEEVNTLLIEEEADELGLTVEQAQIDEWIEMTAQQQGMTAEQFRGAIAQYGIEYDEYEEIIRVNLLRMQLMQQQAQGGAVPESEVEEAYREQFGEPDGVREQIEIRHILLVPDQMEGGEQEARQRAEELREQIVAGDASFEELADTYSQGPGAGDGGHIGTFGRGDLAGDFEGYAFDQEVGEISEPVRTEFGIHLIEVIDRTEVEDPQVEQRMEQVRAQLQEQQMEEQMDSYLETLRTRAFIDIRY